MPASILTAAVVAGTENVGKIFEPGVPLGFSIFSFTSGKVSTPSGDGAGRSRTPGTADAAGALYVASDSLEYWEFECIEVLECDVWEACDEWLS